MAVWLLSFLAMLAVIYTRAFEYPDDALRETFGDQNVRHVLRYSGFFLGDWMVAALVVLNATAVSGCGFTFGWLERPIRYLASVTFALYLFHFPLLALLGRSHPLLSALIVFGACCAASFITDNARDAVRHWISPLTETARQS